MINVSQLDSTQKTNSRKILLLLAVIFILPFTIAVILHALDIRPSGKSYGNLIVPPIHLTIPALHNAKDEVFAGTRWQKKWNIVMIDQTACNADCQATTHLLNNVHLSLDKEIKRVQRILILPTDIRPESLSDLQKKFPDLIILVGNDASTTELVAKFKLNNTNDNIYLVDPLNNLMMHYPQKFEPKGLRGDLVRLLKNSWAG